MTFRGIPKVDRSNAENIIHQDLQHDGLAYGYLTNVGVAFTPQEYAKYLVKGTRPDGVWWPFNFMTFYDYSVLHKKPRQNWRDTQIDKVLDGRKITVGRYPYDTLPIPKYRRREIITDISETLEKKGYFEWITQVKEAIR